MTGMEREIERDREKKESDEVKDGSTNRGEENSKVEEKKKGSLNNSSAASLSVPEMGYRHREVVMCVWGLIIELMDEEEDDVDGSSSRQTTEWCVRCLRVHVCEYSLSFSNCEGVVSTMWACFCVCVCVHAIISGSQLEQIHRKTDCVKAVPCISATVLCSSTAAAASTRSTLFLSGLKPSTFRLSSLSLSITATAPWSMAF